MTEAAPRLLVLSYVGANVSATRVRRLAIIGVSIAAGIYTLVTCIATAAAVQGVQRLVDRARFVPVYSYGAAPPATPAPATLIEWTKLYARAAAAYPPTYLALTAAALATGALIAVFGIARARRWACGMAWCIAVPMMLLLSAVAACMISIPLTVLIAPVSGARTPAVWFAGVGLPVIGLAVALGALLTFDLMACLNWLRRNPVVEMPKRKFLS